MGRHQFGGHPGGALEEASFAAHVEHHASVVDDDPPNVSEQRRLQHVLGRDDESAVGLAAGLGEFGQWQVVGERDQSVPSEQGFERLEVAHDVDDRLRCTSTCGHRRSRLEDLHQRVEATLCVGPRQQ